MGKNIYPKSIRAEYKKEENIREFYWNTSKYLNERLLLQFYAVKYGLLFRLIFFHYSRRIVVQLYIYFLNGIMGVSLQITFNENWLLVIFKWFTSCLVRNGSEIIQCGADPSIIIYLKKKNEYVLLFFWSLPDIKFWIELFQNQKF